jgi:Cft2 family RNA processing exonuclease
MEIIFHGAGREVGKSCIEVKSQGQRYLLDAGVKFVAGGMQYPQYLEGVEEVDAVFLSHAHMDHSGALAFLSGSDWARAFTARSLPGRLPKCFFRMRATLSRFVK